MFANFYTNKLKKQNGIGDNPKKMTNKEIAEYLFLLCNDTADVPHGIDLRSAQLAQGSHLTIHSRYKETIYIIFLFGINYTVFNEDEIRQIIYVKIR